MEHLPRLNLPACKLKAEREGHCLKVWDPFRRRWLVLTPEEWVRRHVLAMLTGRVGVTQGVISQEHPVNVGGMPQRADIVVFSGSNPWMLIECKAPHVEIDASVYAQAVRYNAVVGAEYIMITNGMSHFIWCRKNDGDYVRLSQFPQYG